jgi:glycosyltransferase involved in cell wall biosynthesis
MRVLFVAPSGERSYGGPTQALVGYLSALVSTGAELTLAIPAPNERDRQWLGHAIPSVEILTFPGRGTGAFSDSPALRRWLRREASHFDVVHVAGLGNPLSSFSARICRRAGVPYVIRPYGMLSRYTFMHRRRALKRIWFAAFDRANLQAARAVHFTSDAEREESAWHGIAWGERAHVVAPPRPPVRSARPDGSSRPQSAPSDGPVALVLALLAPVKHVELVIDAWPEVRGAIPSARLVVAGPSSAEYGAALRARAAAGAAGESISFPGAVQDEAKAALLAGATALVLTSYHENFGVVVAEALEAGLPVVVTREVALSTLVAAHGLGVVVQDRSAAAVAAAIRRALSDADLQAHCRVAGPRVLAEEFSPERTGSRMLRMLLGTPAT